MRQMQIWKFHPTHIESMLETVLIELNLKAVKVMQIPLLLQETSFIKEKLYEWSKYLVYFYDLLHVLE